MKIGRWDANEQNNGVHFGPSRATIKFIGKLLMLWIGRLGKLPGNSKNIAIGRK